MTAPTITKYENGTLEPNIETLKKIATALDVSITEILAEPSDTSRECSRCNRNLINYHLLAALLYSLGYDINILEPAEQKELLDKIKGIIKVNFY